MSITDYKLNFLEQVILDFLNTTSIGDLTKENAQAYLPQLVAEVQFRIGESLSPFLTEQSAMEFVRMVGNDGTSPEEWKNFWQKTVPNFEKIVDDTLKSFVLECANIIKSLDEEGGK